MIGVKKIPHLILGGVGVVKMLTMKKNQIHNRKELKDVRILLRKTLTPAEATMWKVLQKRNLNGRKFRRQHSVGDYILDFYCPSERLAIELDGMPHFSIIGAKQDIKRDKYLCSLGIKVLRFENRDIYNNLRGVLGFIKDNFKANKTNHPQPLLNKGGE